MGETRLERPAIEITTSHRMTEPMSIDDLVTESRWPLVKQHYADGYHDAKDRKHDNNYPVGSLRWHAYERGHRVADEWFNQGNTRQQAIG
jgi:hypothetical protein